jgi:ppGpp synthetase/RelA/SpoT-type nucleotidyltranferase
MPLSVRQVNRLGERLKAGPLTEQDRRLLLEYRASFLPAYREVIARIREELGINPSGRPEKTPESIIAKLERGGVKHLADMQDLTGCRIVVEGRSLQNEVTERLVQLFPQAKVKDRREEPSFGYRAVHVIARVQGRQVEVQVRTSLQDAGLVPSRA